MAFFRAMESARPAGKRIFYDPFASLFLDTEIRVAARLSAVPVLGSRIKNYIERRAPGALSSGIARTKYIDDLLEAAIHSGIRQVIILGAGYDTRALRLPFLKNVNVIEVDHPDTARYKIARLKSAGAIPANVSYHRIDFNVESLENVLHASILDFAAPAVTILEGVTNYLASEAVDKTFSFVSKLAKDSLIIFTYIDKLVLEKPQCYPGASKVAGYLRGIQEEWTFGFSPAELPRYLAGFGLSLVEDNGADQYRRKYMTDSSSPNEGYGFYRVAFAKRI
jgi:methyltransferase (TIGR00027 family)